MLSNFRRELWKRVSLRTLIFLGLALVAAFAFVRIADEVLEDEVSGFDRAVTSAIKRADSGPADAVMVGFTDLGSIPALVGVMLAIAALAAWRDGRLVALVQLSTSLVSIGFNFLLKFGFDRPRPTDAAKILLPTTPSFPSGHAMISLVVYGLAAVVLARTFPKLEATLRVLTPLLVLGIGVSRVYLGVHFPTDVLAGYAAGAVFLIAGMLALGRLSPRDRGPAPKR